MQYEQGSFYFPRYEYVSCNQHGSRYKRLHSEEISTVRLSCKSNDANGLQRLVLLSDQLNIPVRYVFSEHIAYIDLMSVENIKNLVKT